MIGYQRDQLTFLLFIKIILTTTLLPITWIFSKKSRYEFRLTRLANWLRIAGLYRLAIYFSNKVFKKTKSQDNKFWATHVLAISYQYSGDLILAKCYFYAAREDANEYQMGLSYYYHGKFMVEIGELDLAQDYFRQTIRLCSNNNNDNLLKKTQRALTGLHELQQTLNHPYVHGENTPNSIAHNDT